MTTNRLAFAALLGALLLPSVARADTVFVARLTGDQEVPPVTTNASGLGVFRLSDDRTQITYDVAVNDIVGVTAGHLHTAPFGESGPVTIPFTMVGPNRFSGTSPITEEQVNSLLSGNLYANAHTPENPGGEIRGQVWPATAKTFVAQLTGDQEVPAVTTNASGVGVFTLDASRTQLIYELVVADLTNVTAAHLHTGAPGESGPVVIPLANAAFTRVSGVAPITEALARDLEAGNLYANVHTEQNPGGEIRGQVTAKGPTTFIARISGSQEVPPVESTATGLGVFQLDRENNRLQYRVAVSELTGATAAHLHTGAVGEAGPVTVPLADSAFNQLSGTADLNAEQVMNLLDGRLYFNAHTPANPGGEIRGQLTAQQPRTLVATLTGAQEVPPVETAAGGVALVTLDPTRTLLAYDLGVADIVAVTAAHFHRAPAGVGGPVVIPVASGSFVRTAAAVPITPELANELLGGGLYLNVHTEANGGGEIRGQVTGPMLGDVNATPGVDVGDAVIALRIAAGLLTATPAQMTLLDVAPRAAPDGAVTVQDVLVLLSTVVGRIPEPL